ncbi:MAG: efflux RND transporter permease subunit [Gammaproteobacteria bacterium]
MISHLCIRRPILASVLSIVITIAGLAAMVNLPTAQYPEITPPQVTVSAAYAGADAETVADSVAAPIETQVNGVDNMIYMDSTSASTGQYSLTVYFEIGTDPDTAQVQVQNRVNLALPFLPDSVQATGVKVEKRSKTFLLIIGVYSPDGRYDERYVSNYTDLYVLDALKRIPGANMAAIFGVPDLAMRIWLDPDRMATLGITPSDIQQAVAAQNQQFGAGSIGKSPTAGPVEMTFPVVTRGRFTEPAEFDNIILRSDPKGVAIVRLKDVGHAELGLKDYLLRTNLNGKTATLIAVYQQPGANALKVAEDVKKTLVDLKKGFPEGLDYTISLDTTKFIEASIDEVIHTLLEAVVLVVLVVYLFLQSFRATVIPTIAVFVSLIGTFIGMTVLGFSINLLTLFGMVVAIGIVVDDAIVVVEAIEHKMTALKLSAREAAFQAMDEVSGPVVAIVLVLGAVFLPTAVLGGTTGQLYKQFAVTIAVSVAISGFVALTLTPALAALMLESHHGERKGFFGWFNHSFAWLTDKYGAGMHAVVKRVIISLFVFGAMLYATWHLFGAIPGSFVPQEDQGYLLAAVIMPDGASLDRTEAVSRRAAQIFAEEPAVKDYSALPGYSLLDNQYKTNAGTLFIALKDFAERKGEALSAFTVFNNTLPKLQAIKEGIIVPLNPPAIPGLGNQGGFEFWIQSRGQGGVAGLAAVTRDFIAKAKERPDLAGLNTTFNASSRQLFADVDREKAETLGVPVQEVYDALQTLFGSLYVSQYNKYSRVWQVILQAEPEYRSAPADIENIYVRQRDDHMVPLSALVKTRYKTGPDLVARFNNFLAAKVTGDAAPGYSTGQAIRAMEEVAAEVLPEGYTVEWAGQAFEEKKAGSSSVTVFAFGLVFVFLILAAQYESWGLPFSVITAVPFGIFGALVGIWLRGLENDVYFQIGLVTLIGLAAKNAILIVEFAVLKHQEGLTVREAAIEAAKQRLRPIVMTSLAFILGCVPLAIAAGAGANARHSVGTGIIGGMVGATTLALFFVPLFYYLIGSLSARLSGQAVVAKPADGGGGTLQPSPAAPRTELH